MYEKPQIERFGTFRQLTRIGADAGTDAGSVYGIPDAGCNGQDTDPDFGCNRDAPYTV
jgi:hypothetical protein